jgi:transposase-like protein
MPFSVPCSKMVSRMPSESNPVRSGGPVLGPARSFATGHRYFLRKSSQFHWGRGHGPVRSIELGDEIRDTDVQTDFSIHFKQGRFTLQLPRTVVVGTRPSVPIPSRVVAIDPGVRRFATTYSPEGSATIYGHNTSQVLDRLSRRIDRTNTTMARSVQKHQESKGQSRKQKGARRTRLRRSKRRYYSALRKAKDVIKDFHYKVSHDLLTRHDTVICPTTSSHRWRQGSSLRSIVKRRIQFEYSSGASLDDLCSVPLCTKTRRSYVVLRHIHPSNVVAVVHYRISLGVARHLVVDNVHSYPIVTYMLLAISFSVSSNRYCLSSGFVIPDNTNSLIFDSI